MRFKRFISKLFNFKKPAFIQFDYIELIIEDRPYLLFTWKLKNGHTIKIRASKRKYNGKSGAVIVELRAGLNEIMIVGKNLWRSKVVRLELRYIQLDVSTKSFLLKRIKKIKSNGEIIWNIPLQSVSLKYMHAIVKWNKVTIEHLKPQLKQRKIEIRKQFELISDKFNYQ